MGPSTGLPKLSRISLFFLVSAVIPAVTGTGLFSRQNEVCGGIDGLEQCGDGLPSEFCCPKDSACRRLNASEAISVICCPEGSDCAFIQPITCDIGQFNAKLHPDNQIHLFNTTSVSLPKCGDKCCPAGYSCNGGMCRADPADSKPSSSPIPLPTPSPSPTNEPVATETTEAPVVVQTPQGFDGKSFVAGLFPGIVLGALGTIGLIWLIKKRRETQEKNRYSGDFGHVSRTISDPIYDPVYAARTDFIRRGSQSAQPSPNSTTGMVQKKSAGSAGGMTPRLKNLWERTPKLGFGGPATIAPLPPAVRAGNASDPYRTPTRTPTRSSISRTPSYANKGRIPVRPLTTRSTSTETIDVLMRPPSFLAPPANGLGMGMREHRFTQDSGHTTFTKLMERAGFEEDRRSDVRNWRGSPARAM